MVRLSGKRMIPGLDHRMVYWWGERKVLSAIDLETMEIVEYPIAIGSNDARLISYDLVSSKKRVVYVMAERGDYRMVYYYDMKNCALLTAWRYSNGQRKSQYI